MKILQIVFLCTSMVLNGRCAKNNDEGRPYEFGFTIDGEQHRYEKKDVNGIIQGEFGFITADGIYHVTTYATDENGSFRILSMRNVRISDPLDGSGGTYSNKVPASEVQGAGKVKTAGSIQKPAAKVVSTHDNLQVQKPQSPITPVSTVQPTLGSAVQITTTKSPFQFTTQPTIKPACASCGYVTRPPSTKKPIVQTSPSNKEINQPLPSIPLQPLPEIAQTSTAQKPITNVISTNDNQQPQKQAPPPQLTKKPACADCTHVTQPSPQTVVPETLPSIDDGRGNQHNQNQISNDPTANIQQDQIQATLPNQAYNQNKQEQVLPIAERKQSIVPASVPIVTSVDQRQPIPPSTYPQPSPQPPSINIEPPAINGKYNQPQIQQPVPPSSPTNSGLQTLTNNQPQQNVEVFNSGSSSTPLLPTNQNSALQQPVNIFTKPSTINQLNLNEKSPDTINKPSLADRIKIEDGTILVPNNPPIKIKDKYPGMVDGLPKGIEEKDITDLLYKFNYTIGFHGHYEKGLRNGTKIGGYFVNGRDGISRVVTYVADELGYRPSFKLINLGYESSLTPKEETEKTFGLKNFEFVWYPLK